MNAESFLNGYPSTAKSNQASLNDPKFRESLCKLLHPTPAQKFLPLIREMFQFEVAYRSDSSNDGKYYENIYWVALFLYQIGDLTDVIPMWQAKRTNMDTDFGFDIQFLVGQGVSKTIEFLHQQNDPHISSIAEHISGCNVIGDFDNLKEWLDERIEYFN